MIGIFDSGMGGLSAMTDLRRLRPSIDICFLADRKNAPYGTKSESELIRLVKNDITRLSKKGAERILMACCTASTVYDKLPKHMKEIAIPIIEPTARAALRATDSGRIGVLATRATVNSHAFGDKLSMLDPTCEVHELEAQELVALIEGGTLDGRVGGEKRKEIFGIIRSIKEKNIDTLILGCTHFERLERELSWMLPGVRTVSSAREGARETARAIGIHGRGRTTFI